MMSKIAENESVVLFPGFGHFVEGEREWRLPVHGVLSSPGQPNLQQRIVLKLLRRLMKADRQAFESEIFQSRIRGFVAATEKGKQIDVRIGRRVHTLQKRTGRNGHFSGVVRISDYEMRELADERHLVGDCLHLHVALPQGDQRRFAGRMQLLGPTGISVISDIDDTIKHSGVVHRRALLVNTFLREFEPVAGMARLYAKWAEQGAALHYVSSSPWQLYDPLAALCEGEGFPTGTFHLTAFRLRDQLLRKVFLLRRRAKLAVIKQIVQTFPERKFVLVGDSGERDPELYGAVARKYPRQTAVILIRDLPERPVHYRRATKAFRRLPAEMWRLFRHAEELPALLPAAADELHRV